jgi:phosphate-selective porin OprO/OprP
MGWESLVRLLLVAAAAVLILATLPRLSRGQDSSKVTPGSTTSTTVEADEGDAEEPRRKLVKWNEYDGPVTTVRFGLGFLTDFVTYVQDDESKQQIAVEPDIGLRDFRFVLGGKFKTERPISWVVGYMYDGPDNSWRFRRTGIMIGVPELSGRLFIGRTKEGYSMVKVMNGYHPWGMERSEVLDAFIPILADGAKWMGYFPGPRVYFSLGGFADWLSEDEKFATFDHQVAARLGWVPISSEQESELLHVAVMVRDGKPDGGSIQTRSRPEMYLAPYFVDTGKFPADGVQTVGVEAFYRAGPWLYGGEYDWQFVDASGGENPLFQGGNAFVSWLITGETRSYNAPGAYFAAVSPARTVFEGGPGAWEAVLHVSYTDFDSGSFRGGTFWRLTPMVNWHMSDNVRLEFVYGYGQLDRFDLKGGTQFFQARIQLAL